MSSLSFQSRQPRRGQALLLAVLIMIFAALLSASFIAVVSVNLNQTARQTDKNRSVVAARAGLDYVKNRLAYSTDGDKWRSELENIPPAPGDAAYSFYYTPLEIAQGWARTTPHPAVDLNGDNVTDDNDERIALSRTRDTGKLELVKSPDPRNVGAQLPDAPTFLSQVQRVRFGLPNTNPDFDKAGSLKITIVGVSAEDPTAYTKSFAYFGGYKNAPLAQTMRVVSNWDFKPAPGLPSGQGLVAQANATSTTTNGSTGVLDVTNVKGDFTALAVPFAITISNPRTTPAVAARSAVVTAATTTTLTLAAPLTPGVAINPPAGTGDRIELAANLGAPVGVNYANSLPAAFTAFSSTVTGTVKLSDGVLASEQMDGARVNGGLMWSGVLAPIKLRSLANATLAFAPGAIFSSGVMAFDATATPPVVTVGTNATDVLQPSDAGGIFAPTANANYEVVNDGWNRLTGKVNFNNSTTRTVPDFAPPRIDEGPSVERYRNATRFSKPYDDKNVMTPALAPVASLYGQGEGIYLDNVDDKEQVFDTTLTPPRRREMTQSEFMRMILSRYTTESASDRFSRLAGTTQVTPPVTILPPASATAATASLEEQHLRGWVGPDEFRPRATEIQLASDKDYDPATPGIQAGLIITRDPRTDNTTANPEGAFGPDAAKAWKTSVGVAEPGIYRREFPWPVNGIVFAEGNVRIKGFALRAPRSLTVVSMGNIYIEDSLGADADTDGDINTPLTPVRMLRRILLMAKKNVVLNPTRVLGRPDAQTTIVNATTPVAVPVTNPATPATITVVEGIDFKRGDMVETASYIGPNNIVSSVGQVTNITVNAGPAPTYSVTYDVLAAPPGPATIPQDSVLRIHPEREPTVPSTVSKFKVIGNVSDAIQRRFTLPTASANIKLAFNQNAERIPGLTVATVDVPANTKPVADTFLSNKRVLDAAGTNFVQNATTVSRSNKQIRVNFTTPTTGVDKFPSDSSIIGFTTERMAQAETFDITKSNMEMTTHPDIMPPLNDWTYSATVGTGYNLLPVYYLAGIGNRYNYGPLPALGGGLVGWRGGMPETDIALPANPNYQIPLATSVSLWLSNSVNRSTIVNERYDATATAYDRTSAFGFDPNFLDTVPSREDVLTSDQSFYQAVAENTTLDSRSFENGVTLPAGENSFTLRRNALAPSVLGAPIFPEYRLSGVKLEDVTLAAGQSTVESLRPAHVFNVNAYVYAQKGSWLVIPGAMFDERVRGNNTQNYLDYNNNGVPDAGEFIDVAPTGFSAGDYADLNRNGLVEDNERYAMERYSRLNYSINFNGAIAENQTALVNDVGTARGAVADWMNKWATTEVASVGGVTTTTFDRIRYIFDPTVVLGQLEDNPLTPTVDETDYGFRLPYAPELFNVS